MNDNLIENKSQSRCNLSLAIFIFVNALFIFKYCSRVNFVLAAAAFVVYIAWLHVCLRRLSPGFLNKWMPWVSLGVVVIAGIAVYKFFPAGRLDVDRWDMIRSFWSNVEQGNYPYVASTGVDFNTPAQSPFYFLLCYPFYKLGLYVAIPLVAIVIWYGICRKYLASASGLSMLLLLTAPAIIYEIPTLSTIFFNSVIVFWWFLSLQDYNEKSTRFFILNGLLGGLMLSTRNVFVIPMIIIGIAMLMTMRDRRKPIVWGLCIIASWATTFLPFVLCWGIDTWVVSNPFNVQSELIMSQGVMAALLLTTVVAAIWKARDWMSSCRISAYCLFLSSLALMIETTINYGFDTTFFGSRGDVTYMIFCLPFILYLVNNDKR